jgi:hypothetical protein
MRDGNNEALQKLEIRSLQSYHLRHTLREHIYNRKLQIYVHHPTNAIPLATSSRKYGLGLRRLKWRVRILHQHLNVLIEPRTSCRSTGKSACAIRLTTRFDPHNAVYVGVVLLSPREQAKACRLNVTPLTPLGTRTRESDATLIDDEVGR